MRAVPISDARRGRVLTMKGWRVFLVKVRPQCGRVLLSLVADLSEHPTHTYPRNEEKAGQSYLLCSELVCLVSSVFTTASPSPSIEKKVAPSVFLVCVCTSDVGADS
jgi:hypothetical protein